MPPKTPPKVNFEKDTCINCEDGALFIVLFTHYFGDILGGVFMQLNCHPEAVVGPGLAPAAVCMVHRGRPLLVFGGAAGT